MSVCMHVVLAKQKRLQLYVSSMSPVCVPYVCYTLCTVPDNAAFMQKKNKKNDTRQRRLGWAFPCRAKRFAAWARRVRWGGEDGASGRNRRDEKRAGEERKYESMKRGQKKRGSMRE